MTIVAARQTLAGVDMTGDLERRIGDLARRQHGVVTRRQMLDLGLGVAAIRHRGAHGSLLRVHRGVYLVGPVMPPLAREMAAILACGETTLLADRSAGALLAFLPPAKEPRAPVEVLSVGKGTEAPAGIHMRRVRSLDPRDRARVQGIPVTSPARTLLDLALILGSRELEQAVARAEAEGLVRREDLLACLARRKGRPGARAMRALLERDAGPLLTRSEAERMFLALIREAQLPPPRTNVRIAGCEVDCLWPDHGIAVEVEGYAFHSSRARFERDRRRVAHLATSGIQVIPVTWRQVVEEGTATAVRLGQALLQAKLQRQR